MSQTKGLWQRIFAERLGRLPVTRVIVTRYHPDHIGLADWLTRRWQVPLWVTEKEWLSARVMSRGADDFGTLRRAFAHRAGLDEVECDIFGHREKQLSPRRAFSAREFFDDCAMEWRLPSAAGNGGSSSAKATPPNSRAFIAPRRGC